MFWKHKKKEIFMTNNLELYASVQQALKSEQIPYEVKVVNTGTQSRRTGVILGRIGEKPELEIFYYVYVSVEDKERAEHAINEYRKKK